MMGSGMRMATPNMRIINDGVLQKRNSQSVLNHQMSTEGNSTDLKHRTLGPNELKAMNSIDTPGPGNESK